MQCFSLQGHIPLGRRRANMPTVGVMTHKLSTQITFILYSFLTHWWFQWVSSVCLFNLLNRELAILLNISVHSLEDTNRNPGTWCGQKPERNQACDESHLEIFCLIFHVWKRTHSLCRCSVKCWFQGWPIQGDTGHKKQGRGQKWSPSSGCWQSQIPSGGAGFNSQARTGDYCHLWSRENAAWLEQGLKASAAKAQEGVAFLRVVTAVAGTQRVAAAWVLGMATIWA